MVEHGDANLDFRDLPVEVPGPHGLAEQFATVHLGFDTAPAVISAPSSPQGTAQVSGSIHASLRALAPALVGFHGLAFLRGGMTASPLSPKNFATHRRPRIRDVSNSRKLVMA